MLVNGSAVNDVVLDGGLELKRRAKQREALIRWERLIGHDKRDFAVAPYRGATAKLSVSELIRVGLPEGWTVASLRYTPQGPIAYDRVVEIQVLDVDQVPIVWEARVPFKGGLWGAAVAWALRDFVAAKIAAL